MKNVKQRKEHGKMDSEGINTDINNKQYNKKEKRHFHYNLLIVF